MHNKIKGLLLTTTLSMVVVFIFFGRIIQNPNDYYFSADGDGFKAYYGAMYHLNYDTCSMRMNGMNYPYGEMVFFTGCQPLVVNTVKFISNNIADISSNIVGIMNLLMIFSIVIAAIWVFLIFQELNVNWIYGALVSVGICMLSPQLARFGGHFSLSWLFWIPLMLWLVIRFDKKPTYLKAVIMGVVTFFAGAMHMYFYAFYGFIIGLYLLGQIVNPNRRFGLLKGGAFFALKYVIPFVIFQVIISANDPVHDRTAFPYGFWAYMAHPVGIFLPSGKPYEFVPNFITVFKHVSWESISFIGVSALFGFCVGVYFFFKKIIQKVNPLNITNQFLLNVLFWSSFAALLFSFGLPFKLGLESLVDKLGPLRQLRALARFSWLFYYVLNIVVFYVLYQKVKASEKKTKWIAVCVIAIGILLFDGAWNSWLNSRFIQNQKPILSDIKNELPENRWVNQINPDDYQAIIPLPYFHVGSENIWIDSKYNTQELTMMVSLKTGLPTTGVQLSRTSIDQTYKNFALLTEPLEPFKVLTELPNQKPFLLLFNRKHYVTKNEDRLIRAGELIFQDDNIELRKLTVESLTGFHSRYFSDIKSGFENTVLFNKEKYLVTDTTKAFVHKTFDEFPFEEAYQGEGALPYSGGNWNTVLDDTLNLSAGKKFTLSFWMNNYKKDGSLRTVLEFVQRNAETDEVNNYFFSDAHRHIKGLHGDWAMIELNFETKSENELIKLSLRNSILKQTTLFIDELMIREEGLDVYYPSINVRSKNSRKLPSNLFSL